MKTGIIINHSYPGFYNMSTTLKKDLENLGNEVFILTNKDALIKSDEELDFDKCIFFDKDVPLGLRLEMLGIRLYNNIGSIELCDDKRRTYELIRRDFKTPLTFPAPLSFTNSNCTDFLNTVEHSLGFPLVAKFAYGSLGKEVFLLNNRIELDSFYNKNYNTPHLYQKFISESTGKDIRVYVIGGKACAAMTRENRNDFRANIALGGTAKPFELNPDIAELCENVASLLGLDFCGVDLLFSDDGYYICEVNSNAMFTHISTVTNVNLSQILAEHINNDNIIDIKINNIL
ncbi:MAG: RimK family alpha-L-glutamate ligase [Clostridiales bacterium]|nr:MAG: RimK family alpha-L-glutamate ligase [Clostridiales bacterium]